MKSRNRITVYLLALALALSIVSAQANVHSSGSLSPDAEQQTFGAGCATRLGITIGLAAGAFSACSVVCAVGAWYSLALLNKC